MLRFIGTKTVNAKPMTRQAYNDLRGWLLPADEDGTDAGYLVEHPDGEPNAPGYAGYVSWSPRMQFGAAYRLRPANPELQPHQQRVVDERTEVDEKTAALEKFFETEVFDSLAPDEKSRLQGQFEIMHAYSDILTERIDAFV